MIGLFSDAARRNPYPLYDQFRAASPILHDPTTGLWIVFDYDTVKRVLTDHQNFTAGRWGPPDWLVFMDPPRQSKLRALISRAFTPKLIVNLEPRIREFSRQLLDAVIERGEMDLAADFAVPLPMLVIAEMLGIPAADRPRFKLWNDAILNMSYTIGAGATETAKAATDEFVAVTAEMHAYLAEHLQRHAWGDTSGGGGDDLLSRLAQAEVDGERLTHEHILGFFQLLLLAGSETTTNLLNNAMLCFIEHPDQLQRVSTNLSLLPGAIEEVLRYRSPLQWMFRVTTRDVELHNQTIPAGKMILTMIGSANRDPRHFPDPARFDITRDPNPHIAFGHGVHFCLGAPLARLEARIALTDLLTRATAFEFASDQPWQPRKGLHVHGPTHLPIRFQRNVELAPQS